MSSRRRTGLVVLFGIAAVIAALFVFRAYVPTASPTATTPVTAAGAKPTKYQCSMHPQIVSDHPGRCPICQMKLTPVEEPLAAPNAAQSRRIVGYRHPMRPDVTSPTPAKDEMGMDYVPIYADETGSASDVPGHAAFSISTERQQLIGVTHEPVRRRMLQADIRTVGTVAYDPALYQAIVEYREAQRSASEYRQSPWAEARRGANAIVQAALLKLRQQGVSEAQLRTILAAGDPVNLLLPGKSVWVYAQFYENDLALLRPGQRLEITAPSVPGRVFTAPIVAIDPVLNAMTRTARVRALVATPEADLRPEAFVSVRLQVPVGEALAVPEQAIFDTGDRQFVFVFEPPGSFIPRAVTLGAAAEDYVAVQSGVQEGQAVVTSANFLIDSESRFRAALAGSTAPTTQDVR